MSDVEPQPRPEPLVLVPGRDLDDVLTPVVGKLRTICDDGFPEEREKREYQERVKARIEKLATAGHFYASKEVGGAQTQLDSSTKQLAQSARDLCYWTARHRDAVTRNADDAAKLAGTVQTVRADFDGALRGAQQAEQRYRRLAGDYAQMIHDAGSRDVADAYRGAIGLAERPIARLAADPADIDAISELDATVAARAVATSEMSESLLEVQALHVADHEVATKRLEVEAGRWQQRRLRLKATLDRFEKLQEEIDYAASEANRHRTAIDTWTRNLKDLEDRGFEPDDDAHITARTKLATAERRLALKEKDLDGLRPTFLQTMSEVSDALPRGSRDRQTMEALDTAVRVAMFEDNYDQTKKKLGVLAKDLVKDGSSFTTAMSVDVGAAFAAIDTPVVAATVVGTVGYSWNWSVRNVGGRYEATLEHGPKAKLSGLVGIDPKGTAVSVLATANGQVTTTFNQTRKYASLEDLIAGESMVLFMAAPLASVQDDDGTRIKQGKVLDPIREWNKLLVKRHMESLMLDGDLHDLGAVKPGHTVVTAHDPSGPLVVKDTTSMAYSGGASAHATVPTAVGRYGISVDLAYRHIRSQEFKQVSFVDDILGMPAMQKIHARKYPNQMAFHAFAVDGSHEAHLKGDAAAYHLGQIERDLRGIQVELDRAEARLATLEAGDTQAGLVAARSDVELLRQRRRWVQDKLGHSLDMLRFEYDNYVYLANQIDSERVTSGVARQERARYLADRGAAGDDAEYVRSVAVNYAYLRRLYELAGDPADLGGSVARADLDAFAADLRLPRLRIADDTFRKAFNLTADAPVVTTDNLSGGLTLDAGSDPGLVGGKSPKVGVRVGVSLDTTQHTGSAAPSKSLTLTLAPSLGSTAADPRLPFLNDDQVDRVLAGRQFTQFFTWAGSKKVATDEEKRRDEDLRPLLAETKKAFLAVAASGGAVEFKFVHQDGSWRLKQALGIDDDARDFSATLKVPVSPGVKLVGAFSTGQRKRVVKREYFGDNTLSALTGVYRERHRVGGTDDAAWDRFCSESGLLDRMVTRIDRDRAADTGDTGFAALVSEIKSDKAAKGAKERSRLVKAKDEYLQRSSSGLLNDLGGWLIDLATSDKPEDQQAATAFIAAFEQAADSDDQMVGRRRAMAAAMKRMVASKTAREDDTDPFRVDRSVRTADINWYVADRLADEYRRLDGAIPGYPMDPRPSGESTIDRLKRRALKNYRVERTVEAFQLVRSAYGLEHIQETIDDLTEFDDKNDRDTAIALIGSDLDRMLASPKVYLSDRVDGELYVSGVDLDDDPGDLGGHSLRVRATIKKGMSRVVSRAEIELPMARVVSGVQKAGLPSTTDLKDIRMVSDHGSAVRPWDNLGVDRAQVQAERKRLQAKLASRRLSWVHPTSADEVAADRYGRRRQRRTAHGISELLKKVLDARDKKRAMQARRARERREAAAQAAADG